MLDIKSAKNKCIYFLSRREYSQKELHNKLSSLGCSDEIIESCLDYLVKNNYQSDYRFTESFTLSKFNEGYGSKKIKYDLNQKGISSDLIESILLEYEYKWLDSVIHQLQKKIQNKKIEYLLNDKKSKAKVIRFLLGRGFDYSLINLAFKELSDE